MDLLEILVDELGLAGSLAGLQLRRSHRHEVDAGDIRAFRDWISYLHRYVLKVSGAAIEWPNQTLRIEPAGNELLQIAVKTRNKHGEPKVQKLAMRYYGASQLVPLSTSVISVLKSPRKGSNLEGFVCSKKPYSVLKNPRKGGNLEE